MTKFPIAIDDLYAQSRNTNFGSNPFDDGPTEYSQNTEDVENTPIQIPDDNRPPSPGSSKNSGGSPVEQTIEPNENNENEIPQQTVRMTKLPKNPKKIQITHQRMIIKKHQKTPKISHCKKNP